MQPSPWFYTFVKGWEQFRPTAYHGKADRPNVWTIAWGHTVGVRPSDTCDTAQGEAFLQSDTASTVDQLNRLLAGSPALNQNQFDALLSLAYNVGCGNLVGHALMSLIHAGQFAAAAQHFTAYDEAGGVAVQGLLNRREQERDHFLLAA